MSHAVIYEPVPGQNVKGSVRIVVSAETKDLPKYFDPDTDFNTGQSLVLGDVSFEQAEEYVARLGSNPALELFIRWADTNCSCG